MPEARGGSPRALRGLLAAAPLVAAAALLADLALAGPPRPASWQLALAALLLAAMLLADVRPLRTAANQKANLGTVPALVAAFLLPPAMAAALAAAAVAGGNLWLRRSRRNALFNTGQVALGVLLAGLVGQAPAPGQAGRVALYVLAALAFSGLTLCLSALAAAFQRGGSPARFLARAAADTWPQTLAIDAIGVTVAVLLQAAPAAAALPLLFLPMVRYMNRHLSRELEARERLARVLASQRRFLTDVSHNVGNPLSTIRTNLSLLGGPGLKPRDRAALSDALAETDRLGDLFRRLRILAETDEELPLNLHPVDLAGMAGELVRAYAAAAGRRGVGLQVEAEAKPRVEADEDLLRQAAANLVENAIRYSPRGARVLVRVGAATHQATLEVIDRGPGIAPELVPVIFDRFQRGPDGGSGLGLAIARNVVERHGGRISVESRPGAGTSFRIVLPAG